MIHRPERFVTPGRPQPQVAPGWASAAQHLLLKVATCCFELQVVRSPLPSRVRILGPSIASISSWMSLDCSGITAATQACENSDAFDTMGHGAAFALAAMQAVYASDVTSINQSMLHL